MIYTTDIKQEALRNMYEDFDNWEIPTEVFKHADEKLILEPHGNYEITIEHQDKGMVKLMGDLKYLQKQQKTENGEFYKWLENPEIEQTLDADIRRDGNYLLMVEDEELKLLNSSGEQKNLKNVGDVENEILAYMWETARPGQKLEPEERGTLHLIPSTTTKLTYQDAQILEKRKEAKERNAKN